MQTRAGKVETGTGRHNLPFRSNDKGRQDAFTRSGHRIHTAWMERMALQDTLDGQKSTPDNAMTLHSLIGIGRAGRVESTHRPQKGGHNQLIYTNQQQDQTFNHLITRSPRNFAEQIVKGGEYTIRSLIHNFPFGNHVDVYTADGKGFSLGAEKLPYKAFDAIPFHGVSHLPGSGNPQSWLRKAVVKKKRQKITGMDLLTCF